MDELKKRAHISWVTGLEGAEGGTWVSKANTAMSRLGEHHARSGRNAKAEWGVADRQSGSAQAPGSRPVYGSI